MRRTGAGIEQDAPALVEAARHLATALLADVGTRLAHSAHVAGQATGICDLLDEPWRSALVPAAWLHDIGYSPAIAHVGFHPLDGSRYLRDAGWPPEVCRLVAFHSGARVEARLRQLDGALATEHAEPPEDARSAITWADLTSSPTGTTFSPAERLAEILRRHPEGTVVHRAVTESRPGLLAAAARIQALRAARPAVR